MSGHGGGNERIRRDSLSGHYQNDNDKNDQYHDSLSK
jgi:hypothetical protein